MASRSFEYDGFKSGDSAYTGSSDYRKLECYDGWQQFHSMQAAVKHEGDVISFKSYAYPCIDYNTKTQFLYVDSECLKKSRTTNRQISRFLSEYVGKHMGCYEIDCAIKAWSNDDEEYVTDGMYIAQYDVMSYVYIVVL